ncbi:MAG TPA: hypothetical protein VFB32_12425 [Rudaea sp.]|nr:hypothetical protein [Rudaea sp.]
MNQLVRLVWDICCLRRGPQDLPYSPVLLLLTCAFLVLLQAVAEFVLGGQQDAVGAAVLSLVLQLGALWLLLSLRGLANRFVQAALALLGCELVFSLIAFTMALLFGASGQKSEPTLLQALLVIIFLPTMAWKILVDAHILRYSLNVPFLAAAALAILWFILDYALSAAGSH